MATERIVQLMQEQLTLQREQMAAQEHQYQKQLDEHHQALDYVRLLWLTTLCELIAVETNRYAFQRHVRDWTPTSTDEIWAFLGTIVLMGYHTLPSFEKYWSNKKFSGVPALQECMTFGRFRGLWGNLHIVDNETDEFSDKFFKVRPVISQLSSSFSQAYNPGQCLSIDKTMIKSKGRAKGKVCMAKKNSKAWLQDVLSILFLLWLPLQLPDVFW